MLDHNRETATVHFPEQMWEYHPSHGKDKSIHERVVKLLRNSDVKNNIESLDGWLYRRIRMCIWKQWKQPRTRMRKLIGLGVNSHYAATIAYDRKGYWYNAGNKAVNWALSKERLIRWGFYDLATAYQSLHVNY